MISAGRVGVTIPAIDGRPGVVFIAKEQTMYYEDLEPVDVDARVRGRHFMMDQVRKLAAEGDALCGGLLASMSMDQTGFVETMLDYDDCEDDFEPGPF